MSVNPPYQNIMKPQTTGLESRIEWFVQNLREKMHDMIKIISAQNVEDTRPYFKPEFFSHIEIPVTELQNKRVLALSTLGRMYNASCELLRTNPNTQLLEFNRKMASCIDSEGRMYMKHYSFLMMRMRDTEPTDEENEGKE